MTDLGRCPRSTGHHVSVLAAADPRDLDSNARGAGWLAPLERGPALLRHAAGAARRVLEPAAS
jgi:hypothetical protein